jgi:UDP-N-acetyl-D-mannosaminuronic acid transferase (WecB/TagA/CpsF family)
VFSQITDFSERRQVFTPNPEMLLAAQKDEVFRDVLL